MKNSLKLAVLASAISMATPALAEFELSAYTGWQNANDSTLTGTYPETGAQINATVGWDGKSFEAPPYYGLRGTWWRTDNFGWGFEYTHSKVYADEDDASALGFSGLEFTDGLNILTANAMYRWPNAALGATPYVGAGLGISLPHVDVNSTNGYDTYGYQVGGPAARLTAGMSYDLTERTALFTEYQYTISDNEVDLDGGGSLSTVIETNAINFGVSLRF